MWKNYLVTSTFTNILGMFQKVIGVFVYHVSKSQLLPLLLAPPPPTTISYFLPGHKSLVNPSRRGNFLTGFSFSDNFSLSLFQNFLAIRISSDFQLKFLQIILKTKFLQIILKQNFFKLFSEQNFFKLFSVQWTNLFECSSKLFFKLV